MAKGSYLVGVLTPMSMMYRNVAGRRDKEASVDNKACSVVALTALSVGLKRPCVPLYPLGKKHVLTTSSKPVDTIQPTDQGLKDTKENKADMNRVCCLELRCCLTIELIHVSDTMMLLMPCLLQWGQFPSRSGLSSPT